jgi:translation initiation factor 2 alpha subunit (eIF-2alpha)
MQSNGSKSPPPSAIQTDFHLAMRRLAQETEQEYGHLMYDFDELVRQNLELQLQLEDKNKQLKSMIESAASLTTLQNQLFHSIIQQLESGQTKEIIKILKLSAGIQSQFIEQNRSSST